MNGILDLLLSAQLLVSMQAPPGTPIHIRLTTAVGSYASRAGQPVEAVVIAPVVLHERTLIPAEALVSGTVRSTKRVGFGIVHETSALGLDFTSVTLPDGRILPISARVAQVDNGRERVTKDGVVHGVRSTSSLCYRTSGYIRTALQWEIHAEVAEWFIRTLLVQVPEPELYYPPGVELTLRLTGPYVDLNAPVYDRLPGLDRVERASMDALIQRLPSRAVASSSRPSDLVNVLFVGSRGEVSRAFAAAGWVEPQPVSIRTDILDIRAVAEGRGYRRAPMSLLFVNHAEPDMSWEKGLNDASKRDHIRIWRQPETWEGRELWVGAATRDVDFAFLRRGQSMTHKVARNVDEEREKVANDLAFTSCVDVRDQVEHPQIPHFTRNATGDPLNTDGRVEVLLLNRCTEPRTGIEGAAETALPMHGGKLQRFVRREILSMRSDLIRTNTYYRCYEGTRWVIEAAIRRHRRNHPGPASGPSRPVLVQRARAAAPAPAS